jgi:hypothetical protein
MGPRFGFSPAWLPTEPGADRQVVARRWLTGAGAIRVSGLRGKGTVWLALQIPKPGPGDKLVYEPGATAPAVTLNSSCGVEANVSGPGVHDVELPIEPPPSGDTCRLQVRANFHLEPQQGGPARAVSLENLAWIPAARQAG